MIKVVKSYKAVAAFHPLSLIPICTICFSGVPCVELPPSVATHLYHLFHWSAVCRIIPRSLLPIYIICSTLYSAVLLNIGGLIILLTVTSLAGIVMFAYYAQKGCDPLSYNDISNSNQLIPYFVMEVLGYPGLPGLFISCLFSGALG